MTRTAALVAWSTVVAVGCAGAAAVLIGAGGSAGAPVQAVDPSAPVRLAQSPSGPAAGSTAAPGGSTPATAPDGSAPATAPGKVAAPGGSPSAARPATAPPAVPARLRLDTIGVAAPVRPVGVDARGDVAIPEAVDTVGWYRYSAPPGSTAGSTVLVGHVDSATQGKGAFFNLRDLDRGDRVVLDLAGGGRLTYRVVSRAQFPKTAVPLAELFSLTGKARLTLITCGGSFDATVRSYADNIVITAVPS